MQANQMVFKDEETKLNTKTHKKHKKLAAKKKEDTGKDPAKKLYSYHQHRYGRQRRRRGYR